MEQHSGKRVAKVKLTLTKRTVEARFHQITAPPRGIGKSGAVVRAVVLERPLCDGPLPELVSDELNVNDLSRLAELAK